MQMQLSRRDFLLTSTALASALKAGPKSVPKPVVGIVCI